MEGATNRLPELASCVAWDLVEEHRTVLSAPRRKRLFVKLGCGEFDAVIQDMLEAVVRSGESLSEELWFRVSAWASGYEGHAQENYRQELIVLCRPNQDCRARPAERTAETSSPVATQPRLLAIHRPKVVRART